MNEYKHYCEKCNYKTNIRHSLLQHFNSELHKTGQRGIKKKAVEIYQCNDCEYNTIKKSNYLTHKLNNHSSIEERKKEFKYYCDICDFGVFTESSYKKHIESKVHQKINKIKQENT